MTNVTSYSITEIKNHYISTFETDNASESLEEFVSFLKNIIKELAIDLSIDVDELTGDISDPVLCKARHSNAIEAIRQTFPSIAVSANGKAIYDPEWAKLAGRIYMQFINLSVPDTFEQMIEKKPEIWRQDVDCNYYEFVKRHMNELEAMIDPKRNHDFTYFGIKTLEKSYLLKLMNDDGTSTVIETPQRMYLRIAAFLQMPNLDNVKKYYDYMSLGYFTHASPTMFNCGIKNGSLASCYLLTVPDSLKPIFKGLSRCALISKNSGGIGLDVSQVRHSKIGNSGNSAGIVPMLQVFNKCMNYVDQGGKRKGSATIFLPPWHLDIIEFLNLKMPHGKEENRARDLFYSVYNCDLFMKRVHDDGDWMLFCPTFAPMLNESYGPEFDRYYIQYEKMANERLDRYYIKREKIANKRGAGPFEKMRARKLWDEIISVQMESSSPFMTYKDTANMTSNQQNLGIIRSLNLCVEIAEVTDENTISSCNLASIALDEYVRDGVHLDPTSKPFYDFHELGRVVRVIIRGLNRVIDRTHYPLTKYDDAGNLRKDGPIKSTNLKYRPLGLGVQALADAFLKMGLAWTDKEARELNRKIFATIYYHAVDESVEIAKETDSYDGFYGSPASQGRLKPDLIIAEKVRKYMYVDDKNDPEQLKEHFYSELDNTWDWDYLRERVKRYGLRNSLLIALMPTASSAQIRNKNEAFEPFNSNLYTRTVLSGYHLFTNCYMVNELKAAGLWNRKVINNIINNQGSVQKLTEAETGNDFDLARFKQKYLTAFELPQKLIADFSIDRAMYVCQSQSLNVFVSNPSYKILNNLHFHTWKNALTTGMYYMRSKPSVEAVKILDNDDDEDEDNLEIEITQKPNGKNYVCTDDVCVSCQS